MLLTSCGWAEINLGTLLDEMIDRERIARFPTPEYSSNQASSYDRASQTPGTAEWFANDDKTKFIRSENTEGRTEWVMMEAQDPGSIVRWWITGQNFPGTIRIYLDGNPVPVVQGKSDELIGGSILVEPPLSSVSAKGRNLYLPIPYGESCKITYEDPNLESTEPVYYNIEYRTYETGTDVRTFTDTDTQTYATQVADVGTALLNPSNNLGTVSNTYEQSMVLENHSEPLEVNIVGGAAIKKLMLNISTENYVDVLTHTWIEIQFDDALCVQVPVSEFFGCGRGLNAYEGWWKRVETSGTLTSYWVMPFDQNATIKIFNRSHTVADVSLAVSSGPWSWDAGSMYFHATNRRQNDISTKPIFDWTFVDIKGQGVYVGDTLSLYNPLPEWWGEGDEKIYVDGEPFPSHFGTGTEDYYGYAWGLTEFFEAPFIAQPIAEGPDHGGHITNTRTRSLDAIPFNTSLKFDMEVLHWRETDVDYSATSYWYAKAGATINRPPVENGGFEETAPITVTIQNPPAGDFSIAGWRAFNTEANPMTMEVVSNATVAAEGTNYLQVTSTYSGVTGQDGGIDRLDVSAPESLMAGLEYVASFDLQHVSGTNGIFAQLSSFEEGIGTPVESYFDVTLAPDTGAWTHYSYTIYPAADGVFNVGFRPKIGGLAYDQVFLLDNLVLELAPYNSNVVTSATFTGTNSAGKEGVNGDAFDGATITAHSPLHPVSPTPTDWFSAPNVTELLFGDNTETKFIEFNTASAVALTNLVIGLGGDLTLGVELRSINRIKLYASTTPSVWDASTLAVNAVVNADYDGAYGSQHVVVSIDLASVPGQYFRIEFTQPGIGARVTEIDGFGSPYIAPIDPPLIMSWSTLPNDLMKIVVNTPSAADYYFPQSKTNLMSGSWGSVAHSDDGVHSFLITNLDYSTTDASGTNKVIYLETTDAQKFFNIIGDGECCSELSEACPPIYHLNLP